MKEAMLFEKLPDGRVRCGLCAHRCVIKDSERGLCQVRENRGGTLYTLVYGRTITQHVDPVEKKPLFHFYPGSTAYSVATPGCNFRCRWCQNWDISQVVPKERLDMGVRLSPTQVVIAARRAGCQSVAYTYTEPTVFFEYTYETARLAQKVGLANLLVTNGYMSADTVNTIAPYLDAANVDLKAFVQCAGSRDEKHLPYCSAVCCMASLKQARYVRELNKNSKATLFYIDIRTVGRLEKFYYDMLEDENVAYIKGKVAEISEEPQSKNLILNVEDTLSGKNIHPEFDMVVLATGIVPNTADVKIPFELSYDQYGFIDGTTDIEGVFAAGCTKRPCDVSRATKDGTAAALKAIQCVNKLG